MALNEERRQAEIAAELEEVTRVLAHSTRTTPGPSDASRVLGELQAVTDHLAQICQQLAAWHDLTADGAPLEGEDGRGEGFGIAAAAVGLRHAAAALSEATGALTAAHAATGGQAHHPAAVSLTFRTSAASGDPSSPHGARGSC